MILFIIIFFGIIIVGVLGMTMLNQIGLGILAIIFGTCGFVFFTAIYIREQITERRIKFERQKAWPKIDEILKEVDNQFVSHPNTKGEVRYKLLQVVCSILCKVLNADNSIDTAKGN